MAMTPIKADQSALDLLTEVEIHLVKVLASEHPECTKLFPDVYRIAGKLASRRRVLDRAIKAARPKAEAK